MGNVEREISIVVISVRDAVSKDRPALRELFLQSRRQTFVWQQNPLFQLSDFDRQTDGERLRVAEDVSAGLMGFISIWEPDAFIHHLYVGKLHARRGVGRTLLRALPDWTTKPYHLKCLRANEQALLFYRACHFIEVGSGTSDDGDYVLLKSEPSMNRLVG